jgi:hypothetical protein
LFLTGSEVIRAFVAAGKFTWTGAAVPADSGKPTANTIQSDRTIVLIDIVNLQFNTHPDQAGRYSSPIITIEHKIMCCIGITKLCLYRDNDINVTADSLSFGTTGKASRSSGQKPSKQLMDLVNYPARYW